MLELFSFLYLIIGLILLIIELVNIKNRNSISLFSIFKFSFAAFHLIIPAIILYRVHLGVSSLSYLQFSSFDVFQILLFTLLEYGILSLIYKGTHASKKYWQEEKSCGTKTLFRSITLLLTFSTLCLLLWVRAFGSINNLIINADSVRAGYSTVHNSFAFLEHFVKVYYVCLFLSVCYMVECRKITIRGVLITGISLWGSVVVMLCTDARGAVGEWILIIAIYIAKIRIDRGKSAGKQIMKFAVILALAFILSSSAGTIFDNYRFGTSAQFGSIDIGVILERELGFTFYNKVYAFKSLDTHIFQFKFWADLVNALLAFVPSRFTMSFLPEKLWAYNTSVVGIKGTSPTDFVTASIYMFGFLGCVILPSIVGWALKKLDSILDREIFDNYRCVYFAYFSYLSVWWPGYFGLYNTMLMIFPLIITHLVVRFVDKNTSNTRNRR